MKKQLSANGFFIAVSITSFFVIVMGFASSQAASERFKREEIATARFGEGDRETFLRKAHTVAKTITEQVRGQDVAAQILQNRLVQYFENFGTRESEPIYMNLIGLPGVGKTAMLKTINKLDFPVLHYDAQNFSAGSGNSFSESIYPRISRANRAGKPLIIVVEELDKVPEITSSGEMTSSIIGTINQILSDGVVTHNGIVIDAHNVMVLTTMNFSPDEMERFTEEVLDTKKSFYDLTIADMQKFNDWIKSQPSARYKILSHLFRSNTVRRMAPFTVIMQPLLEDTYRQIITNITKNAVERNTTGKNAGKKVKIELDPTISDFLFRETVFAPSGAGETVLRADAITDQLINFAIKAFDGKEDVLDRPRSVKIAINLETSQAMLTVTPYTYRPPSLVALPSFNVTAEFDRSSGLFMPPQNLAVEKPTYESSTRTAKVKPITQKETSEFRFPKSKNLTQGLEAAVEEKLLGQSEAFDIIQNEMNKYMSLKKPTAKEPMFKVLSGFPGIGKSEIVRLTADYLKLPVIKVNMQQFISDDPKSIDSFFAAIVSEISNKSDEIEKANGKYVFLLEELDKCFEIAPDGSLMNRPIMGIVKDLLNDGKVEIATRSQYGSISRDTIDIRGAFTFITMNFSVDRFGFSADPRMTSIEDVISAWKRLNVSVASIKNLLGSMFLPETVSRLMSQFIIMKPLTARDYREIILKQVERVIYNRLLDEKGRNVGQIRIELSPRYKEYLFNETVIPSEGARSTVVRTQNIISTDLEFALSNLPKSKFGAKPIVLTLDFFPSTSEVITKVKLDVAAFQNISEKKLTPLQLNLEHKATKPVTLTFPRIDIKGKIPEYRLATTAHELGHALIAARLGLRIDQVVVVPTLPGAGGYVKFKGSMSKATEMMANVYATLASRAMERIIFSKNPRSASSVLEISAGPSRDILQATQTLFNMLYELGFDPNGGTIDRNFRDGPSKYADFASITPEMADRLGKVLRRMEDQVLDDLLTSYTKEWFVEKTVTLARKGAMNEEEFYQLIEFKHPGPGTESYGRNSHIRDLFAQYIKASPNEKKRAQLQKRSLLSETVEQTLERYLQTFAEILQNGMHSENKAVVRSCRSLF